LVALCQPHHRLHHKGRLGIAGDADDPNGLVFTDAEGRRLAASGRPVPPDEPLVDLAARLNLPTDGWVHPTGERLDPADIRFDEGPEPASREPGPETYRSPGEAELYARPLSKCFVYDDDGNLLSSPAFDDDEDW